MKFKKGDLVEILRRENEPDGGSWFPGHVISERDTHLVVKYDSLLVNDVEPSMEKVSKVDVRPRPMPLEKKWRVGDVAEVFDARCWRIGKIVKALKKKNKFVMKLSGSIQLKEFHVSNLRVQQVWHKNKWFLIGKADGLVSSSRDPCSTVNTKKLLGKPSKDLVTRVTQFPRWPLEQGNADVGEGSPSPNYPQCSVASCSSNDVAYSGAHDFFHRPSNDAVSENSDAESSFPSLSAKKLKCANDVILPSSGRKVEADVHALEFHAYTSTVKALYASGPLSWEQELLLTNLRQSLHISDDEHMFQLRKLLSTQVL